MKIFKCDNIRQNWNVKEKNHPNHRWNRHQNQRFIPPNIREEFATLRLSFHFPNSFLKILYATIVALSKKDRNKKNIAIPIKIIDVHHFRQFFTLFLLVMNDSTTYESYP